MVPDGFYADLAEIVRQSGAVWHAADLRWMGPAPAHATEVVLPEGVTWFSPQDLVISAKGGTRISALRAEIRAKNLDIGLGFCPYSSADPTLSEALGLALPHVLENRYGTWREWVLGMTVILGDGVVAKSGCRAVKSVAGYDAHKLFVGARGSLGIIAEVTLRLYPASSAPPRSEPPTPPDPLWIHRVLRSDFAEAEVKVRDQIVAEEPETGTLWGTGELPDRRPFDWLVHSWPVAPKSPNPWLARAKELLDPQDKMNPGQLEVLG